MLQTPEGPVPGNTGGNRQRSDPWTRALSGLSSPPHPAETTQTLLRSKVPRGATQPCWTLPARPSRPIPGDPRPTNTSWKRQQHGVSLPLSQSELSAGVSPLLRRSQGTRMAAGSCKWRGSPWGLNWLRSQQVRKLWTVPASPPKSAEWLQAQRHKAQIIFLCVYVGCVCA